ncbi:MAG: MBL fold metallo-hydrolase, partial [Firmicutes bacterium]|nr:MBL fold metallo-hydrolase [Bacillota bacterium]
PDIKVVASKKEEKLLYSRRDSYGKGGITADVWTHDGDVLKVGDMELKFISTPGHTPGGQCVLVDRTLFSGDTLFHASVGRTDLWGGSFEDLMDSITKKLFLLPEDTTVLPGHMDATTIGWEMRYNPFV